MGDEPGPSNSLNSDRESIDDVNRELEQPLQSVEQLNAVATIPVPGHQPLVAPLVPPAIEPTYEEAEMTEAIAEQSFDDQRTQLVVGTLNSIPPIPAQGCLVACPIVTMSYSETDELARAATASRTHYCNSIT